MFAAKSIVFLFFKHSEALEDVRLCFLKVFQKTGTYKYNVAFVVLQLLKEICHRRSVGFVSGKERFRIKTLFRDFTHRRKIRREAF